MKLLHFYGGDELRLGLKTERGVVDVAAAGGPSTLAAVLAAGEGALAGLTELEVLDEAALRLGPCVANPEKILCIGLNYRKHAIEAGFALPETPVLFSKFNNALTGAGEAVALPRDGEKIDYEVELGVVIGREGRYIKPAEALNYVFGYCTANDLSVRDLQFRTGQWLLGKSLDGFLPLGPYLVTADEVADPQALWLRCWVNGELRQDSTTADMIFSVADCISYASQYMTLKPGDVIITGTPEGVAQGMSPPAWLKAGDEVVVEVEGLGRCLNRLMAPH